MQLGELRSGCKWGHVAMARKKASLDSAIEEPSDNESVVEKKPPKTSKAKSPVGRTRKKAKDESPEGKDGLLVDRDDASIGESSSASSDDSNKTRRTRKKGNLLIFVSNLNAGSFMHCIFGLLVSVS